MIRKKMGGSTEKEGGQAMKYMELIEKRCSIREFRSRELNEGQIQEIKGYFDNSGRLDPDIGVELVISAGDEYKKRLEGSAGYRGNAFGAPAYLTILSEKKDKYLLNAGYIAEELILKLTDMGLSSCWLTTNGSDNVKRALHLEESTKEAVVVIACGYGKKESALTRLDIHTPSNIKVKTRKGHIAPKIAQEDLVYYKAWGEPMDWNIIDPTLDRAFYAASLAPSFLNKQPYRYVYTDDLVILYRMKEDSETTREDLYLDAGATMANFDLVYTAHRSPDKRWVCREIPEAVQTNAPEDYRYVAYFDVL